jgi:ribosome-associated protein
MIAVTSDITIHEKELLFSFTRASGPGGQNVNKVATAVQLRFDIKNSPSLDGHAHTRTRLIRLGGKRITTAGILVIHANRFRSQERNRQDAIDRLVALIRKAALPPKTRHKTRPSKAAKERIKAAKRRRSHQKKLRRRVCISDE